MSTRLRTILEWTHAGEYMRHDLSSGSHAAFINNFPDRVAKITGPTHPPYWLKVDGTKTKKEPGS